MQVHHTNCLSPSNSGAVSYNNAFILISELFQNGCPDCFLMYNIKSSWEVFFLSQVPSVGFDFEIRISLAAVTGILGRNPHVFSCFQCIIICSFGKDLNTFENLRASVTDTSIFSLTRCLLLVFLSSLSFHLYCFLQSETRQIACYFSTSFDGLWATACKLTQRKKCSKSLWHFSNCDGWLSRLLLSFSFCCLSYLKCDIFLSVNSFWFVKKQEENIQKGMQ